MESVEVSARSVEEAVQQALIRLGRSRDEVEITVLSEGHRGILGFVRGESARVRVAVRRPSTTPSAKPADGGFGETSPRPTELPGRSRSSRGRESVSRPADAAARSVQVPSAKVESVPTEPAPRPSAAAIVAKDTLEELLEKMGIDADAIYKGGEGTEDSPVMLNVVGDDLGILIGRRGETLASLQFLLNLMVGKRLESWARVTLDVEGYRARREESLRGLAERVADRVRRTGQPVALEPMPPNERRIVHLTLQENPYVTTESTGYGEERRVTVIPRR